MQPGKLAWLPGPPFSLPTGDPGSPPTSRRGQNPALITVKQPRPIVFSLSFCKSAYFLSERKQATGTPSPVPASPGWNGHKSMVCSRRAAHLRRCEGTRQSPAAVSGEAPGESTQSQGRASFAQPSSRPPALLRGRKQHSLGPRRQPRRELERCEREFPPQTARYDGRQPGTTTPHESGGAARPHFTCCVGLPGPASARAGGGSRPRPRSTAPRSGKASFPSLAAQQVGSGQTHLSAMAALPASGAGCETRSRPRPGAVRPDPGPPATPRVPLPGAAVLGRGGTGRSGMERAGRGDAAGSGGAAGRGQPLVAGAAAPERDRVRRTLVSQSSGPSAGNKESGSGAGTSVLEALKLYLRYRSMAKVSGRDPFCEENCGQAGHILPSPWGPFGSAVVAGPRCGLCAAGSQLPPVCTDAAASRCPGTWGFIGSALPSGTPDILQEHGWKAAGRT